MRNFLSKKKGNYPLNSKTEHTARGPLVWIFIAFLALTIGKELVGGVASVVTTPFYFVRHYIMTSSATVPTFLRSRAELLAEKQELERKILEQTGSDAVFAYLMQENEELRNLLHASTSPRIGAGVISRPPHTPYDTLILDRGSEDGIVPFAPVYYGKSMGLGYVREVFAHTALVTLFSSPEIESTVYVFGPDFFTTAYGEGGGVVRLSVPQGIRITRGDIVVLPSLDTGVLGAVSDIQSIPTEPEQHAYVTLSAPLQSIRVVSVGMLPLEPISFEQAEMQVREEERRIMTFTVPEGTHMDFAIASSSQGIGTTTSTTTL